MPKVLNFKVVVEQDADGYFIVDAPSIPGCHSQGKTYEEAIKNIGEAIKLCLEVAEKDKTFKEQINLEKASESAKFVGIAQVDVAV